MLLFLFGFRTLVGNSSALVSARRFLQESSLVPIRFPLCLTFGLESMDGPALRPVTACQHGSSTGLVMSTVGSRLAIRLFRGHLFCICGLVSRGLWCSCTRHEVRCDWRAVGDELRSGIWTFEFECDGLRWGAKYECRAAGHRHLQTYFE